MVDKCNAVQEAVPILSEEATEQSIKLWVQDRVSTSLLMFYLSFVCMRLLLLMVLSWTASKGLLELVCVSWDNWCIASLLTADPSCTSIDENKCVGKVQFSLVILARGYRKYRSRVLQSDWSTNSFFSSSVMLFSYVYYMMPTKFNCAGTHWDVAIVTVV